jgi:hypothetical protein
MASPNVEGCRRSTPRPASCNHFRTKPSIGKQGFHNKFIDFYDAVQPSPQQRLNGMRAALTPTLNNSASVMIAVHYSHAPRTTAIALTLPAQTAKK